MMPCTHRYRELLSDQGSGPIILNYPNQPETESGGLNTTVDQTCISLEHLGGSEEHHDLPQDPPNPYQVPGLDEGLICGPFCPTVTMEQPGGLGEHHDLLQDPVNHSNETGVNGGPGCQPMGLGGHHDLLQDSVNPSQVSGVNGDVICNHEDQVCGPFCQNEGQGVVQSLEEIISGARQQIETQHFNDLGSKMLTRKQKAKLINNLLEKHGDLEPS